MHCDGWWFNLPLNRRIVKASSLKALYLIHKHGFTGYFMGAARDSDRLKHFSSNEEHIVWLFLLEVLRSLSEMIFQDSLLTNIILNTCPL